MADEELKIKIDAEEDVDQLPSVKVDVEKAKDPAVDDLKSQFETLKTKAEEDRKHREDAERRASEANQEAARLRKETETAQTQVTSSQLETVTTALEAANAAIEAAERDIQSAIETGDAKSQTTAYTRLSKASATALRLEEAKEDLEAQSKAPRRAAAPSDPVEAFISGRTPRTASWLREHRDYLADERKRYKLDAAHASAKSEGFREDTDDYFSHVEKFLGMNGEVVKEESKPAPKRKETPIVASGGTAQGASSGGNEVVLSAREARAAQDGTHVWNYDDSSGQKRFKKGDPIGIQEFARRKREMTRQGLYDKTYTEG